MRAYHEAGGVGGGGGVSGGTAVRPEDTRREPRPGSARHA